MKKTNVRIMKLIKYARNPLRKVYLTDANQILKVHTEDESRFFKYSTQHPNQFVRLISHTKQNNLYYDLYEKLDFILDRMKLTRLQMYSMIVQVALITRQMRAAGWVHGDLHEGNIGAEAVKSTRIVIDGTSVPTYGYRFKLLDFGLAAHKSDSDPIKKDYYKTNIDLHHVGSAMWYLLVPTLNKGKYDDTYDQFSSLFNIKNGVVKRAMYKVMRGESKTTLPLKDILFFAKHGILSDPTIDYLKHAMKL